MINFFQRLPKVWVLSLTECKTTNAFIRIESGKGMYIVIYSILKFIYFKIR